MSEKSKPKKPFSRRSFIQTAAMTAATLALPGCSRKEKPVLSTLTGDFDPLRSYPYRGWEDFYRKIWTWDKVVRSTHSANCTGSCSWNVYVRNGVIVREEQAASDEFIVTTIRNGRKGTAMPSFQPQVPGAAGFTDADLGNLLAFVRELGRRHSGGVGAQSPSPLLSSAGNREGPR